MKAKDFASAETYLKQQVRLASKEKLGKEERNRLRFLHDIARSLLGADKIVKKSRHSHKQLEELRRLTVKYRESFAYFQFLELENHLREKMVLPIWDFEPPVGAYRPVSAPVKLFEKLELMLTRAVWKQLPCSIRHRRFDEIKPCLIDLAPLEVIERAKKVLSGSH